MTDETLAERTARYERVHALRATANPVTGKRWTMEDIGATFDPPLTKQRVKQILDNPPPLAVGRPRKPATE
jgi:DNA-directed RNA polymerase sigma subunit (sigma70/sigma32)